MKVDSNRFLFAGNKMEETKSYSLASTGIILRIEPKKGYSCVRIGVNLNGLVGVKIALLSSGDGNLVPSIDSKGEIHTCITTENCGGIIYSSDTTYNSYYISWDELTNIRLYNDTAVEGSIDITVAYLKSMPSSLVSLRPTQILYSKTLTATGTTNTLFSSSRDEFSLISQYFKYIMVRLQFKAEDGTLKTVSGHLYLYPYGYFIEDTHNVYDASVAQPRNKLEFNTNSYASEYIENRFTNGFRLELTGNELVANDKIIFQIIGIR